MSHSEILELEYTDGIFIPYEEIIDEKGYGYDFYIEINDRQGVIFICESGMDVKWKGVEGYSSSNIVPKNIFGKVPNLTHDQMRYLLKIYYQTGFEGKQYSQEDEEKLYQKWINLGRP